MAKPKLIELKIPEHLAGNVPDHKRIGQQIDSALTENFLNREVIVRCIGSQDHEGISLDKLTVIILRSGTDKYDKTRVGVGYIEFNAKGIKVDFYGEEVRITQDLDFMAQQIWEMHHSAIGDRGYGVHVDLVLVYDASKVEMVMNLYDFHPTSDGYVFKDPNSKIDALLGVIKITSE